MNRLTIADLSGLVGSTLVAVGLALWSIRTLLVFVGAAMIGGAFYSVHLRAPDNHDEYGTN